MKMIDLLTISVFYMRLDCTLTQRKIPVNDTSLIKLRIVARKERKKLHHTLA